MKKDGMYPETERKRHSNMLSRRSLMLEIMIQVMYQTNLCLHSSTLTSPERYSVEFSSVPWESSF